MGKWLFTIANMKLSLQQVLDDAKKRAREHPKWLGGGPLCGHPKKFRWQAGDDLWCQNCGAWFDVNVWRANDVTGTWTYPDFYLRQRGVNKHPYKRVRTISTL
jgi:hypothetical protein